MAHGWITHNLSDHGFAIKVPPTRRSIDFNGQKLGRQGEDPAAVPEHLGIRAERWQEICWAWNVRAGELEVGEMGG